MMRLRTIQLLASNLKLTVDSGPTLKVVQLSTVRGACSATLSCPVEVVMTGAPPPALNSNRPPAGSAVVVAGGGVGVGDDWAWATEGKSACRP